MGKLVVGSVIHFVPIVGKFVSTRKGDPFGEPWEVSFGDGTTKTKDPSAPLPLSSFSLKDLRTETKYQNDGLIRKGSLYQIKTDIN